MSSTRLLKRWISRAFLRPSHHYIPCRKEERLVVTQWGRLQLWREYSHDSTGRPGRVPMTVLEIAGGHDERRLQPEDELAYVSALRRLLPAGPD